MGVVGGRGWSGTGGQGGSDRVRGMGVRGWWGSGGRGGGVKGV